MKPTFDEAFKVSFVMIVLLRIGAYATTTAILANNGTELNPNALFTPTFMLETAFLYLLILVAMSFFETTSIRLVGYSLAVAIPFGDFFWDAMQLANMPLNDTLILDLVQH